MLVIARREFRMVTNHPPWFAHFEESEEIEIGCGERKVVKLDAPMDMENDKVTVTVSFGKISAYSRYDKNTQAIIFEPVCDYDIYEII